MRHRFRLFSGEDHSATEAPPVSMRLEDLTRILSDAHRSSRAWLADFADEEVQVSGDLFEVLTAYERLRRAA